MKATMKALIPLLTIAGISNLHGVLAETYNLAQDISGPDFFNEWVFYDHFDDTMNGHVTFLSAQGASSNRLAYVDSGTNRAIMKLDNTSLVPWNEKRNSVRVTSKRQFGLGSVVVVDMWHVPFGCSVWPALWSWAEGQGVQWPAGGEIDIMEGINRHPTSQMGLHTPPGCTQVNPIQSSNIVNGTNCEGGAGCIVTNDHPAGYGEAFNRDNGGLFVTELAESAVSIWFVPRSNIDKVFNQDATTIETNSLGTPMGNWPRAGCNFADVFLPQKLIFDITLCGDFAGSTQFFPQTCPGDCYLDYVINSGSSEYANAFFDIGYVKFFDKQSGAGNGTTGGGSNGGGGNTGGGNTGSGNSTSGNGGIRNTVAYWSVAAAGLLGLFF